MKTFAPAHFFNVTPHICACMFVYIKRRIKHAPYAQYTFFLQVLAFLRFSHEMEFYALLSRNS